MSTEEENPTFVRIHPKMVGRIGKFIAKHGEAEGNQTITSVVRRSVNEFLKKYEI